MTKSPAQKKSTWTLYAMFILFLFPFIAATMAYYYRDTLNLTTKNYGELITPPQSIQDFSLFDLQGNPLPKESLIGSWWLVLVAPKNCTNCDLQQKKLESVYFALNRDTTRVKRMILNTQPDDIIIPMQANNNEVADYVIDAEHSSAYAKELLQNTVPQFLIIDPLGNIVMHYPADAQGNGILRDLLQLLKVSRIG